MVGGHTEWCSPSRRRGEESVHGGRVPHMTGHEERGVRSGLAVLAVALLLAGCAPVQQGTTSAPPPASTTPVPAPSTPAPASEPPRATTPAPSAAVTDSGPSAEAERVLSTIPEPLGGAPRPTSSSPALRDTTAGAARRATAMAPAVASDTLRASRPNDDEGGAVPVPAPTTPLRSSPVTIDTSAASLPAAAPMTPPAASSPPATSAPASPEPPAAPPRDPNEPCWRLQVAAPAERDKADSRMAAAQSLLLVPMVIERERGLYKVRTRDCQSREAADALRRRAIESGFDGAFIVKGVPPR
jgi:hypothetical protein